MIEKRIMGRSCSLSRSWQAVWLLMPLLTGLSACAPDYLASKVTGRQCQAGYLEEGEDWCAPPERTPPPQPYCTQSWNGVDCWARPELTPNMAHEAYEGPRGLTPEQNANRLMMPVKKVPPSNQYFTP
ncbi:hypothetical protein [Bombella saccharophila]|uniref:Uncharacterized protein n=1 Tax=Bombella saccharophila TaxID=2967338 RepID=A0ABT3W803_9PROT|nr:hypothetical protein [Bombella saccharophila]MCX5614933.1 hypothetical protein [Bombella saccharophila]